MSTHTRRPVSPRPNLDGFVATPKKKFDVPAGLPPHTSAQLHAVQSRRPLSFAKATQKPIGLKPAHQTVSKRLEPTQDVQSNPMHRIKRPLTEHAATPEVTKPKRFKLPNLSEYSRPQLAIMAAACMIFLFGVTISIMGYRANEQVQAQADKISQSVRTGEDVGNTPDETEPEPGVLENYRVEPMAPRIVSIAKIGVKSRVKPLGTKSNNELKAPANIYDTGWYDKSSRPGEPGAVLLDGHVHGLTKPGVFYNLKKLKMGDIIELSRGDEKIFKYKIVTTEQYTKENLDMTAAITSIDPDRPGLNIISSIDQLGEENSKHNDRLFVRAVLVD